MEPSADRRRPVLAAVRFFRAAAALVLAGWLGGLASLAAPPTTAFAHANLERAEPTPGSALDQAPRELRPQFSGAVDPRFSPTPGLARPKDQGGKDDSPVAP